MAAVIKKSTAVEFDRPSGVQAAVIADITDPYRTFNKQTGEYKQTMNIIYQLSATYEHEGQMKRHIISEFCTPSMHEKSKFRARLEGILGRKIQEKDLPDEFSCADLIGRSVLLNLIRDEDGYSKVQSVSGLPAGTPEVAIVNYVRPPWIDKMILASSQQPVDPSSVTVNGSKITLGDVVKMDLSKPLTAAPAVPVSVPMQQPPVTPSAPVVPQVPPVSPKKDLNLLFRGI